MDIWIHAKNVVGVGIYELNINGSMVSESVVQTRINKTECCFVSSGSI